MGIHKYIHNGTRARVQSGRNLFSYLITHLFINFLGTDQNVGGGKQENWEQGLDYITGPEESMTCIDSISIHPWNI